MPAPRTIGRSFYIFEGIVFIILGIVAIALPIATTVSIVLIIGWLLIIGGVIQIFRLFQKGSHPSFWMGILKVVLPILVGILLVTHPMHGMLVLTLLLGVFFLLEGIMEIGLSLTIKGDRTGWGFLMFSGILSLILAAIILFGLPGTAAWAIGLLLGINFLFFGISMLFVK